MWKIKLQKIVGNLLDKLRKLHIDQFLAVPKKQKILGNICFSEHIFQSLGAPAVCRA